MIVAVFMTAPAALAGNNPDFDAVCLDACNYFASQNIITQLLIDGNLVVAGGGVNPKKLNFMSDWCDDFWTRAEVFREVETWIGTNCAYLPFTDTTNPSDRNPHEFFYTSVSDVDNVDPCFPNYRSMRALWFNTYFYAWKIVLQKKPETDLQIKIVDCVLKHQGDDIFEDAEETGWYNMPGVGRVNTGGVPNITAIAYPGPNRTLGFAGPFVMDAIVQPGPNGVFVPLCEVDYLSKAIFEEGIFLRWPATGQVNGLGLPMFDLHQGDEILIIVIIPSTNPNDIAYGRDNVRIEYVGYNGSEFWNGAHVATYTEVCP
jgi:hypothetical protein